MFAKKMKKGFSGSTYKVSAYLSLDFEVQKQSVFALLAKTLSYLSEGISTVERFLFYSSFHRPPKSASSGWIFENESAIFIEI